MARNETLGPLVEWTNPDMTRIQRRAQTEARAQFVDVVIAWGEQRGVDVKELVFRLRTHHLA